MSCKRKVSYHPIESQESAFSLNGEESLDGVIEISINSIENIVGKDEMLLRIVAEHRDINLGESHDIPINSNWESLCAPHPVNFSFDVSFPLNNLKGVEHLVSNPVLIKVYEITTSEEVKAPNGNSKSKGKAVVIATTELKIEQKLLGMCNLDLVPLVLGEFEIDEKLVLEAPNYSWDNDIVPWAKLPRLSISMKREDFEILPRGEDFNILSITVESIYNPPGFFHKYLDYKCATVLRTDKNVEDTSVVFGNGRWTEFHDVEQTKSWRPLANIDSRARLSKYKISCDCEGVKSAYKKQFDLKTLTKKDVKRIEWNSLHRALLDKDDMENVLDRLKKRKYWPFEIMVTEDREEEMNNEGDNEDRISLIYQCYVDTSQLLFPGLTRTRILAQLYTQSSADLKDKTELAESIFEHLIHENDEKRSIDKSDSFEYEGEPDVVSIPVFNDDGSPVLLLVEFELYRPFCPSRVLEDYTDAIEKLKRTPKEKGSFYAYTPHLVHDQYVDCIKELIDVLGESYRDFVEKCNCRGFKDTSCDCLDHTDKTNVSLSLNLNVAEGDKCPYSYVQDELSGFKQFLHESGKYVCIRSELKDKITNLLDQEFSISSADWSSHKNQNFIATSYTYLVENMHKALNTKLDVRKYPVCKKEETFRQLWFRAEEAYEFHDYEKADKLYIQLVSDDRKYPEGWVRYGAYCKRKCQIDEAIECCKMAIQLNPRHKTALLFYGVLLAIKENYKEAEVILKSLLNLYPRFAEGWAVLHLFYIKIDYVAGIDLALDTAEKCLFDRSRDMDFSSILNEEPMAWSTLLCRNNRIFHLTAVLLLKLHLYEFAGLALTQDLCHHAPKSVEVLYFLGVKCYLHNEPTSAMKHLGEAEQIIGLEYSVTSLIGHVAFATGKDALAIEQYEALDMMYDRPDSIHLVHMRLGFHYIDAGDYERARGVFLRAARHLASCKTWLGVGAASFFLRNYEESEVALTEANRIDDEDPDVWAYLCLLSATLRRLHEFEQCYRMMVKNNLRSDKLWRLIKESMEAASYSTPIVQLADYEDKQSTCCCQSTC